MRGDQFRQGQPQHLTHGNGKQNSCQPQRPEQSPFHGRKTCRYFLPFTGKVIKPYAARPSLKAKTGNGLTDNALAGLLRIKHHRSGLGGQIDRDRRHTGQTAHHFFNTAGAGGTTHPGDIHLQGLLQ